MYINTFKYTPKDVSCQLCTEYVKKLGCTALRCPWLAERIEAGVVGYREAILETFPHERRLFQRLNLLIKHYPGSLWSNEQHECRMQYQCAVQGYRRRRDTNAYYAAMYLLTSNDDIYRRTVNCFCKDGIEFGYAFTGWYSERSLTNKVSGVYLTKDMTVYAGWRVTTAPQTDDSSVLGLWGISLCTSLAGCLALTTWQIRRRREEKSLQSIEK